jgi:hypothetical protein
VKKEILVIIPFLPLIKFSKNAMKKGAKKKVVV